MASIPVHLVTRTSPVSRNYTERRKFTFAKVVSNVAPRVEGAAGGQIQKIWHGTKDAPQRLAPSCAKTQHSIK